MHLVGRYHRVRRFGASGVGPPMIWDQGRAWDSPRMLPGPYGRGERGPQGSRVYDEWVQTRDGVWLPQMRGGAGGTYIAGGIEFPRGMLLDSSGAASQVSLALDSNYVNTTSGDAIAGRYIFPQAETLATVYFFAISYTGTAANVNDLTLEFRNNNTTTGPGGTLHDGGPTPYNPSSTTGWLATGSWTFSASADTQYWLVVGDADGNGTDFVTVLRNTSSFGGNVRSLLQSGAWQTTDGWSSVRTSGAQPASIVIACSSGRTYGNPLTAIAASTSSTNQRGLRFVAPAACKVYGMISLANTSNNISGINLWSGANGPGGSADANGTISMMTSAVSAVVQGRAFATRPSLTQGTTYRLVFTYSAAATTPSRLQIGTGTDATLRSAMLGGGNWYWTEADGTTDWANDNTSEFPAVDIVMEDFVTASGGSMGISQGLHTITNQISA